MEKKEKRKKWAKNVQSITFLQKKSTSNCSFQFKIDTN